MLLKTYLKQRESNLSMITSFLKKEIGSWNHVGLIEIGHQVEVFFITMKKLFLLG
jgi:hypothetical protein